MGKKIMLSSTISISNTVFQETFVSGQQRVLPEKTQSGVKSMTYSVAVPENCDSKGTTPEAGDKCRIYGGKGAGDCILSRKVTSKEGGASGVPYTRETLTFLGV